MKDLFYGIKHQKIIFDLAGPSEKYRAGKKAPSFFNLFLKVATLMEFLIAGITVLKNKLVLDIKT